MSARPAPPPAPAGTGLRGAGAALLLALALAGCRSQRWPKPMADLVDPLPPGDVSPYDPGPGEAIVFRHGDPVQVRRAGARAGFPLTHYDKRERVLSGGWILVGPGGRGEVFWPDTGTVAVFFDQGAGVIGEPSRGEPDLDVRDLTSLRLTLGAGGRVRLPGGAEVRADPTAGGGPYDVRRVAERLVRVRNQSTAAVWVDYRHETIQLGPGDVVDLAVLESGAGPPPPTGEDWAEVEHVLARGEVEREEATPPAAGGERAVRVRARSEAELVGQGVRVRLLPGEAAVFRGLGDPARGFQREGPASDDPARDDLRLPRAEPLLPPEAPPAEAVPPAEPVPAEETEGEPAGPPPEGAEAPAGEAPMIPEAEAPSAEPPGPGEAPPPAGEEPPAEEETAETPVDETEPGAEDAVPPGSDEPAPPETPGR